MSIKRTLSPSKKIEPVAKRLKIDETFTLLNSKLHEAVKKDQVTLVTQLLEQGAIVDLKDEEGYTPLFKAVLEGKSLNIIKELLKYGSNPMAKSFKTDGTILHFACGYMGGKIRFEVVEELLKHGVEINAKATLGQTPLFEASLQGKRAENGANNEVTDDALKVVKLLLEKGANLNAIANGQKLTANVDILNELLKNGSCDVNFTNIYGETPFLLALKNGHVEVAEKLFEISDVKNLDIEDVSGKTPLYHASKNGLTSIVALLLQTKKVNINANNWQMKRTPLHIAVTNGHTEIVRMLLKAGADVNIADYYRTPLHTALKKGHEAIAKQLLDVGANYEAITKQLLDVGANLDSRDYWGKSSLDVANSLEIDSSVKEVVLKHVSSKSSNPQNSPVTEVNKQSKIEDEHVPEKAKPNEVVSKPDKSKDVINQKAEIDNLDASIEKDAVFEMSF